VLQQQPQPLASFSPLVARWNPWAQLCRVGHTGTFTTTTGTGMSDSIAPKSTNGYTNNSTEDISPETTNEANSTVHSDPTIAKLEETTAAGLKRRNTNEHTEASRQDANLGSLDHHGSLTTVNHNGNNKANHRKKRKKEKINLSFCADGNAERHAGSFADATQRKLFDVTVSAWPTTEDNMTEQQQQQQDATSKKKVAVLLAYLGTHYGGFQINRGVRSVQAQLELALYQAGFISADNFGHPSKYSWSTSGRTDKGVHAAAQTISFKMELSSRQLQALAESSNDNNNKDAPPRDSIVAMILDPINAHLPQDIRVLDVKRTTRNFCAKTQRDRVRYQYLIPSFVFSPLLASLLRETVQYPANEQPRHLPVSPSEMKSILAAVASYRVAPEQWTTLKNVLQDYVGTHAFHNFTRRCAAHEMRAKRYIMEFAVANPILVAVPSGNGDEPDVEYEWIPTSVTGQSFLFNQIRKMISLAMDVTRGVAPKDAVTQALTCKTKSSTATPTLDETSTNPSAAADPERNDPAVATRRQIGVAPAQGLYLDMSFYASYNRRKNEHAAAAEIVPPDLEWSQSGTAAHERWRAFRDDVIMKHVIEEEAVQGNFIQYLYMRDFKVWDGDDDDEDTAPNEESDNA
jgi:tRNA pseudouridine38-40 synthase